MDKVTPEQVQERFDRLTEIFSGIVTQADDQASERCPYRDRHDHCTAKFRCRNQRPPEGAELSQTTRRGTVAVDPGTLICSHNGTFDYRNAWESDPRAADTARKRIARHQRPRTPDPGV